MQSYKMGKRETTSLPGERFLSCREFYELLRLKLKIFCWKLLLTLLVRKLCHYQRKAVKMFIHSNYRPSFDPGFPHSIVYIFFSDEKELPHPKLKEEILQPFIHYLYWKNTLLLSIRGLTPPVAYNGRLSRVKLSSNCTALSILLHCTWMDVNLNLL